MDPQELVIWVVYLVVKMVISNVVSKLGYNFTLFRGRISTNLQGLIIVITQLVISY